MRLLTTIALGLGLARPAAAAPTPRAPAVLDLSGRASPHDPVARDGDLLCAGGDRDGTVLAAAVVVYGRHHGASAWGHISLRFLACADGALRDVEYEATRLDGAAVAWFARLYPDERWYRAPGFRRLQRDRLILFRNEAPVDRGVYAAELDKNRAIHEAWMDWPVAAMTEALAALDAAHADQMVQLRAGQPVDRPRYRALRANCTAPVRAVQQAATGTALHSPTPMGWLRRLERDPTVRLAVHPSAHVLARIQAEEGDLKRVRSGMPTRSFRPLLRRRMDNAVLRSFEGRVGETAWSVGVAIAAERHGPAAAPTVSDGGRLRAPETGADAPH